MENFKGKKHSVLKTDVLVIGGGGAALRAALQADESGAEVLIASKGPVGKSGATYYSVAEIGAFNVPDGAMDEKDNPDAFYKDIMDAALGVANPKLARIVADEAVEAMKYLESRGMEYARDEKQNYMVYRACFSTRPRSHVVKDHFRPIVKALSDEVEKRNIRLMENVTVTDLIVRGNEVGGAFAIDDNDNLFVIRAKAVIVASGGASTLFKRNMYPSDITGDGYAMAKRAGAKLTNMEFIQAGIGLAHPAINLFGNQLWVAMPNLTNGKNESFLEKYIEGPYSKADVIRAKSGHFPFSTRDISKFVEISVQREITEGTPTENGNVYLDFLSTDFEDLFRRDANFKEMWPLTYDHFLKLGRDLYKEKIEIACFAHAINGGIMIDENAESTISGLFAAGETASGPHGADRLGGNMSVTCQVFGRRAGIAAAKRAKAQNEYPDYESALEAELDFLNTFAPKGEQARRAMLERLQQKADASLLIVRDEARINGFLKELGSLEEEMKKEDAAGDTVSVARMVELKNLCGTGEMIATAALLRRESRGSHYRSDFPSLDEKFAYNIIL